MSKGWLAQAASAIALCLVVFGIVFAAIYGTDGAWKSQHVRNDGVITCVSRNTQ